MPRRMRVRELDARGHGGAAAAAFVCRHAGRAHAVAVLKATFTIVPGGVTSIAVPSLFETDEQTAPSRGAMRATRPSDVSPPLPGAEVLLDACAFAAQGNAQGAVAVRLYVASRAGAIDKTLHVYGDRTPTAPQPQPFERMPIVWERAIGGVSSDNPVGRPVGDPSGLANVVHAQQAWVPAGLGPIAASWPARRRLVGDGGEPVVRQGELVVPDDLPLAWFHAAPADQRLTAFERELWLVLDGMHPTLPRLSTKLVFAEACARLRLATGETRLVEVKLDRLLVEAERGLVTATWRGWSPVEDGALAGLTVEAGLGPWPPPEALFDTDPASETVDSGSAHAALRAVLPWARASMDHGRSTSSVTPSRAGLPFAAPPQPSPQLASPSPAPGSIVPAASTPAPLAHVARALAGLPFVPAPSTSASRSAERSSTSGTPFGPAASVVPFATAPLDSADDVLDESTTDAAATTPRAPAVVAGAPERAEPPLVPTTAERIEDERIEDERIEDERTFDASSESGPEPLPNEDPLAGTIGLVPPPRVVLGEATPPPRVPIPPARVGAMSLGGSPLALRPPPAASAPLDDTTNDSASDSLPPPGEFVVADASAATTGNPSADAGSARDEPRVEASRAEPPHAQVSQAEAPHASDPREGASRLEAPYADADATGVRAVLLARVREGASVSDLALEGADLQGIDLRGADLRDAKLTRARLVGAQLDGASLVGAVLVEADLSSASLVGADLARADLSRATLSDAALERAVLERARLVLAVLERVRGPGLRADHAAFEGVQADDACFVGASLQFVDLRGGRLNRADLSGVVFVGADLTDVQASGACLDGATLTDVRAVGATLHDGSAKGARAERSNWERAQLERSDWSDADLSESTLERALATGANFTRARLRDADLTAIVADDTQLVDAVIDGAELRQARLAGARASGVSARGVVAPKLAAPGLGAERSDWSGATLRTAKLRGARFEDANLDGVDLRDADLVDADLRGAVRTTTKLGGASLRGAKRTEGEPPPNVD